MDVGVLTPSYDFGRFIADGIESVIQQQGLRLQHIIQDAGSGDETLESCGPSAIEWNGRPRPIWGQSDGLNRALAKATGDWIAWLNADEYEFGRGSLGSIPQDSHVLGSLSESRLRRSIVPLRPVPDRCVQAA
jgi:glycosyltransferase involved in cell wall biosynthesis